MRSIGLNASRIDQYACKASTTSHASRRYHCQLLLVLVNASCSLMSPCTLPAGISLKTQELYLLVFVTRYLDLFYRYISL